MHLALCVNAFRFTGNTRVNASHAQNLCDQFSRFQVMALTHHHTKVILIFKHHIAVPTTQFEQTSTSEQIEIFPPPLGSSILKDALTYVNASSIHTRGI